MAGEGSRFKNEGYKTSKPLIPTTLLSTGEKVPMVIAASLSLPHIDTSKVIYLLRSEHIKEGADQLISKHIKNPCFIEVKKLTDGQASTCLLAKDLVDLDKELFIAGCDNGMIFNLEKFLKLKDTCDIIVFTFRNHDQVLANPEAYGWVETIESESDIAKSVSVKKSISQKPMQDHAITSSFWFRRGRDFLECTEEMIACNDRINNEFYMDQVVKYALKNKLDVRVFEIDKYLGWGTPLDHQDYENSIKYWKGFIDHENI